MSNEKDNTITVIDADTLKVTSTIPVGDRPRGIVLSKDARTLYICTSDSDHIEALDLATLKVDAHPAERPGSRAVRAQP